MLVVANFVDLSSIASVGSAVSMIVFVLVGAAGYQACRDREQHRVVLLAHRVTVIVLAFFAVDTLRNAPETFIAIVAITLLAVALDFMWKRMRPAPPPTVAPSA